MATVDRKLPSPDAFLYKPWSAYTDAARSYCCDNVRVEENNAGKELLSGREAMKLSRDDMRVFGQCPAHDDFYLVVCNICNQVVKPQGFEMHYERRHGSPSSPRAPALPRKPRDPLGAGAPGPPFKPFRVPGDPLSSPFGKAPQAAYLTKAPLEKSCVPMPVVSLEKMPHSGKSKAAPARATGPPTSSAMSLKSSVTPPTSHKSHERVVNGRFPTGPACQFDRQPAASPSSVDWRPSVSPSSLDRRPTSFPSPTLAEKRPTASPSSLDRRHPGPSSPLDRRPSAPPSPLDRDRRHHNGAKATKPHGRLSGRVFDPNKHCGVLDPESRKPCTRSLTCKTHSLTHRRAVPGRKKLFDSLLAEHKGRAKEKEAGRNHEQSGRWEAQHSRPAPPRDSLSSASTDCQDSRNTAVLKSRLTFAPSLTNGLGSGPTIDPAPTRLGGDDCSRLSSDDGEMELTEDSERTDCPYMSCHPQPMACCTFRSRLMGRGHYVFDRRWDRMRLVLHCMIEKHVSSQMWKKIPMAAESHRLSTGGLPALQPQGVTGSACLSTTATSVPALSDSVSMATCSAAFPLCGRGSQLSAEDMDSFVAPSPALAPVSTQGKKLRAKSSDPQRLREHPLEALAGLTGGKKGKPPSSCLSSTYTESPVRNFFSPYSTGPPSSSNGVSSFCAKTQLSGRSGPTDSGLMSSHLLQDDRGTSDHTLLSLIPPEGRKRKGTITYGKASKVVRTSDVNSVFRKSTSGLLSSVSESPHNSSLWQSKVHH
ncbi:ataxin-7-like protein 1 isoform X2 [Scleropages formosus]|uniref:ataxin-7-like protein 1 isoform X2 n=1 Tax=Scleropages formosus TaxID=113540 RepID=UPI0010FAAC7C|nr:ataxin-7-like protein 1 isoform X2 [Scleropages formosus]